MFTIWSDDVDSDLKNFIGIYKKTTTKIRIRMMKFAFPLLEKLQFNQIHTMKTNEKLQNRVKAESRIRTTGKL